MFPVQWTAAEAHTAQTEAVVSRVPGEKVSISAALLQATAINNMFFVNLPWQVTDVSVYEVLKPWLSLYESSEKRMNEGMNTCVRPCTIQDKVMGCAQVILK